MINLRVWVFSFLFISISSLSYGQRVVQGMLRDSSLRIVAGASVQLISGEDSVATSSSVGGIFRFADVKAEQFKIRISSIGFESFEQEYTYPNGQREFIVPTIHLKAIPNMLEEVVINGVITIQVKGDTVEYAMDNLKLRTGDVAEDALKKLQGVEVDKDGNVTAQGEEITRVRINGKDFFGGDVKTATQNLPADIIQKIQVVDDYGDMANLTGNKSGESTKIINIQIDPQYNNGYATTLRVGGGTEKRYQTTGMFMGFKEKTQVSLLGNLNNMNAPLFDFSAIGGGARRRPGRGGGMFGGADGITNTGSIGVNLRHDFSEQLKLYGSYSYGRDDNNTESSSYTEYIGQAITQDASSDRNNITTQHRFEANLEWNITSKDYIKITPQFGFNDDDSRNVSHSTYYSNNLIDNVQDLASITNSSAPRYNFSGLYNRRLNEKGRNLFIDFNYDNANTTRDIEEILDRELYDPSNQNASIEEVYEKTIRDAQNKSWNAGSSLSYLEPLSTHSKLEISYDFNTNKYDNYDRQNAYDKSDHPLNDPSLNFSYDYDYGFTTHKVGASYMYDNDKIKYSIGAAVQPSLLRGNAYSAGKDDAVIDRSNFNFIPIARFEYKFSRQSNLTFNYSGRSSEPGVSQILPFEVSTNRTNTTIGNANLEPEFRHSVRFRFRSGDFQQGKSFFAMLRAELTQDKIVSLNKRYMDNEVGIIQDVGYVNESDPVYNIHTFYNWSRAWKEKTYNLMYGGGVRFDRSISYLTDNLNVELDQNSTVGFDKGIANNTTLHQMLFFRYNPSENLEINPGIRYNYSIASSTLPDFTAPNTQKITPTLIGSVNLSKSIIFGLDVSKEFNSGYRSNVNPFIINSYIEHKFLKEQRGTIRLQAFDLLNEQTNINRTVGEILTDSQTNRLARYFMLTFTFKLQKFAGINPIEGQNQYQGPRRPRM